MTLLAGLNETTRYTIDSPRAAGTRYSEPTALAGLQSHRPTTTQRHSPPDEGTAMAAYATATDPAVHHWPDALPQGEPWVSVTMSPK